MCGLLSTFPHDALRSIVYSIVDAHTTFCLCTLYCTDSNTQESDVMVYLYLVSYELFCPITLLLLLYDYTTTPHRSVVVLDSFVALFVQETYVQQQ